LAESRTTTEIVELLLDWPGDPVVTWTVLGTACTATLLAVVATKTTFRVAAGILFGPEAVIVAGPAEVDEIDTPGVSPVPLVVEGLPVTVPRLAAKVTLPPTTGSPLLVQRTETAVGVFKGMSVDGAGVVNAKPAVLLMVKACVLVVPAAVAVITSLLGAVAVTTETS
jgi:hypothetical protein